MICKIGAAAAAGLTATLLLTGAAGANTFHNDQSVGGFTVVSKPDPEKCKEDGKTKSDPAPSGTAPSDPGAAGSDQSGSDQSGANSPSNPPASEPAAGILPSTGSATGKTTREPGEAEKAAPQKECKSTGTKDESGTGTKDESSTGTGTGTGTQDQTGTGTGTTDGTSTAPSTGDTVPVPAPGNTSRTTH
ncbi:hypothetical protein F3087_42615 [Nocardia colli]|uniref:Uncharacterized protein n=1 Tax=Nocardia colli TaxID=2545717 RepID=A0A5N0DVK4_9NOCA|nr:hypothetical protein [Nocardia colli]KAA8880099.1 hypothetical protein F3087_42615 [Nocardia colli]